MTVTTRRATPDDIPLLVGLMREFYAEGDYRLDEPWAASTFHALLADEALGAAWIVFCDNEPAGYVVMTVRFSMEFGGPDACIDDLFVRPDVRRRGLGQALLRAFFDECTRRGVLAVHVEVGQDNTAARGLYAHYGLRDIGRLVLTATLAEAEIDASPESKL